jgi:signal transduction histidine kinase
MNRDLRTFLLAIGLPAVMLVVGGLRLISTVAGHLDETDRAGLGSAAAHAAADIRLSVHAEVDALLDEVAAFSDTNELRKAAARLESSCPWIRRLHWEGAMPHSPYWRRAMGGGRLPPIRVAAAAGRTLLVELDPLYVLSRLPGFLRRNGMDDPADKSRLATIVEIRRKDDALLMPATSLPLGDVYGEASLAPDFPDWKVRICRRAGPAAFASDRVRFLMLGGVLLFLLFASLVAGGVVLLRAARKARRDALVKTDFISNLSHEFKTPLTTISLCAELSEENELDNDERRRAAGAIRREVMRLQRMVQNVLDYGRLESGRRVYFPEIFDLGEVVHEMSEFMKGRFAHAPHVLDGECRVFADRDAVDQILLNLFDNACKYGGDSPMEISFGVKEGSGLRTVRVADRGPGLTAEQRRHVFDRFWRADDSTTSSVGGNGLGLSIARALARGMGGDLAVAERDGGGCVFTLELPAHAPENNER